MRILGLDLSTNTGWCLFVDNQLSSFGLITKTKSSWTEYGEYPSNFISIADDIGDKILTLVETVKPDAVVVEEVNKTGRFGSRFSQKLLDQTHYSVVKAIQDKSPIYYINTSDWRKKLNLSVAETKKRAKPFLKQLATLKKEFLQATKQDKKELKKQIDALKVDLKSKCIHAKIDKKSISVAHVNLTYNLNFKKGDNDAADAICLTEAYIKGVPVITNKDIFEGK